MRRSRQVFSWFTSLSIPLASSYPHLRAHIPCLYCACISSPILGSRHFNSFLYYHFSHCIYLSLAFNLPEFKGIDYPSMTKDLFKSQLNLCLLSWSLFTLGVCALYIVFHSSNRFFDLIWSLQFTARPFHSELFLSGLAILHSFVFCFVARLMLLLSHFFFSCTHKIHKTRSFFCIVDGCLIFLLSDQSLECLRYDFYHPIWHLSLLWHSCVWIKNCRSFQCT